MGKYPKTKYVTDDYVEKVNHYVYNNLSLRDLYVSQADDSFNEEVVKEVLDKDEQYIQLENRPHVILTSKGRLINTVKIRQYSVRFSPNTVYVYISSEHINMEELFLENGWEYSFEQIKNTYKKRGWVHQDYSKISS